MKSKRLKPKKSRRVGRPNRATASEKALAGVDLSAVDPRTVLLQIAADPSAPAPARVAACRLLMGQTEAQAPTDADGLDALSRRAVQMMKGRPN